MRKTLTLVGVVILILIAGAWFYLHNLDSIVKSEIEKQGSEITGVAVKVNDVKLSLKTGVGEIYNLTVANPTGFTTPVAFSLAQMQVAVDTHTIPDDMVRVHRLELIAPDVTVEQNATGNNIQIIQENIKSHIKAHIQPSQTADTSVPPAPAKVPGKRFWIESFVMKNATLHVSAPLVQAEMILIPLADLELTNLGATTGGLTASELADTITQQISLQIAHAIIARDLQNMVDLSAFNVEPQSLVDRIRTFLKQ